MNDWTAGYRAALADVERLYRSRAVRGRLETPPDWLLTLLQDMQQDALVIEHEQASKLQRRRLRAAQEAGPAEPLFEGSR